MDEYIKSMVIAGYTDITIKKRCLKKGYKEPSDIDIQVIRNNVKLQGEIENVSKADKGKTKGKHITPLFNEVETYFTFAKRVGIETEYTNIEELIGTVQKLTADIFIRQAVCLLRGLELLSEGQSIDLELLYKGYAVAFTAIDRAWGMQTLIDLNAAIQNLEGKGFSIDVSSTNIPQISEKTQD